jgi:hypothetical protein
VYEDVAIPRERDNATVHEDVAIPRGRDNGSNVGNSKYRDTYYTDRY